MFPVVLVPSKILGSFNAVCNPVSPPVIGVKTEAAKANDICAKARVKIEKYIPERRSEINPIISAKIPATAVEIIIAGITLAQRIAVLMKNR